MNFLAPGTSYSSFLKSFGIPENKFFFCYERLTRYEDLECDRLPEPESFWSTLKQANALGDDAETIARNYRLVADTWEREGMRTLRDLLAYYNSVDVRPFCLGVEKLLEFFHDRRVDLFKTCFSAPGAARQLLFRHSRGTCFPLIGKGDEDLAEKIKFNLVSGPSLIMNRFHAKGETFIRDNPEKPFRTVQGWDASNLYGKALSDELLVGVMHRWLPIDDSRE